jgi:hypothetical protein
MLGWRIMRCPPQNLRARWQTIGIGTLFVLLSMAALCQAERTPPRLRTLEGAKQVGLSCAFFANVPVLTELGGIRIVDESPASRQLVAGIYGLRRGDFRFASAFDRGLFFELFGIPAEATRIDYPDLPRKELMGKAEEMIRERIVPLLDAGGFVSVRARGPFGGPHNVLLVAHDKGRFHYHDPTSGEIRSTGLPGLAANLLSESKAKDGAIKKRYFSSYHSIPADGQPRVRGLRLDQLPTRLAVRLDAPQRRQLAAALTPAVEKVTVTVDGLMDAYPAIDFAVAPAKKGSSVRHASAIDSALPAKDLGGAASLAKLALNSHQIGARELLPVWIIDGRPRVITGYASSGNGAATLTWFDGVESAELRQTEALSRLRASGALVGYVKLPRS